jgi:plastocyanin
MRAWKSRWPASLVVAAGVAVVAAGCGGSSSSGSPAPAPTGFVITISGMAFSPVDLHVPPGQTVTVVNRDGMDHSVTSEAAPNAFTPGAASGVQFDTGPFTGQRTFTIPANAPEKATIPYYCTVHRGTMATPNGTITIDSSAAQAPAAPTPSPMPAPGGGGY